MGLNLVSKFMNSRTHLSIDGYHTNFDNRVVATFIIHLTQLWFITYKFSVWEHFSFYDTAGRI